VAAQRAGILAEEIVPVTIPSKQGDLTIDTDEHPRVDTSLESLAKLRPVLLASDPDATVTAGNASGQNDASAMCLVTTGDLSEQLGLRPVARLVSWGLAGVEPSMMGLGPIPATEAALGRAGLTLADMDLIELNEAFAAQALVIMQEWKVTDGDHERPTSTGPGSPWATPSAPQAFGCSPLSPASYTVARHAMAWKRCASAAGRAWLPCSSGSPDPHAKR
jgi:acetyl-CoA C-acetyltransferase